MSDDAVTSWCHDGSPLRSFDRYYVSASWGVACNRMGKERCESVGFEIVR